MKKVWILLTCLASITSAYAEAEYMCGSIPFVPNKSPMESCGSYCGPIKTTTNYPIIEPNYYAQNYYVKAKNMYNAGQCDTIKVINTYKEKECGGLAKVKQTKRMTWTEITGGNEACRMNQYKRKVAQEQEYVQKFINGEVDINGNPIK